MRLPENFTILYMDDDGDDIDLLTEAVQSIDSSFRIAKAGNGLEGLNKLQEMKHNDQLPCLIILDINMPKLNGKDTFQLIKADEKLAQIPVVIFSTSTNPADKNFFSATNTEYITKPVSYPHFLATAKRLLNYCAN